MKKILGILGGMGPAATADLFAKIVALTDAKSDNDHLQIRIDCDSAIPDRTAAILEGGVDPVPEMLRALRRLEGAGAECIILPCNTAHFFLPQLEAQTSVPFLSMLEVTAAHCRRAYPGKTAAVLATRGTLATGLYDRALEAASVPYLLPDEQERDDLMAVIYRGVKAGAPAGTYRAPLERVVTRLAARGADYFILGCTELPLAVAATGLACPVVDPTRELAKAAILCCGGRVKEG